MSYADTIGRAVQTAGVDRVVTRHSSVMTIAELKEFGEFNADFVRDAQTARKTGKTIDQFVAEWSVPAKYAGYTPPPAGRAQWKSNAEVVWAGK